ncbi:hypothetical protein ASPBRDRAFT_371292 [Aspergillus brasiliensis CBS 101740]|uniref:Uncharacterized protein n=1 Tax=Aspergillus brasiliensis (strain CBS 101740 / IMI 381727 / IBT 21946) TaxID=767769 RepID=A0A1L9UUT1_ASPBC|nr:hypothetical protein ASPBRDRAFT_371292 [Aspergillus brasiliensis CBS 101740]
MFTIIDTSLLKRPASTNKALLVSHLVLSLCTLSLAVFRYRSNLPTYLPEDYISKELLAPTVNSFPMSPFHAMFHMSETREPDRKMIAFASGNRGGVKARLIASVHH